jgi:hypothetical protein
VLDRILRAVGVSRAAGRAVPPEALQLLKAFLEEAARRREFDRLRIADLEHGRAILAASAEVQLGVLLAAADAATSEQYRSDWRAIQARSALVLQLLRSGPPLASEDLERLAVLVVRLDDAFHGWCFPVGALLGTLERAAQRGGPLGPGVLSALRKWRVPTMATESAGVRKFRERLQVLLGRLPPERPALDPGEPWADAILGGGPSPAILALLRHAGTLEAARPSRRWLDDAKALLDGAGDPTAARLAGWLLAAAVPAPEDRPQFSDRNAGVLRGLCWVASLGDPAAVAPALRALGDLSFRKVANVGARSHKVGNACVGALGALSGTEGVARLGQLRLSVKYAVGRRLIEKALAAASERAGMAAEDLEDLAIPSFGLGPDGCARRPLGAHAAVLSIRDGGLTLSFEEAGGAALKTVPAEVRRVHAPALAELRRTVKDAERMRAAQSARLEAAPLDGRRWPLDRFRERWLDHPLVGDLARRLVWRVRADGTLRSIVWDGEVPRGVDGGVVPLTADGAEVTAWHPLGEPPEAVLAWRRRLAALDVTQPFKQVHREVYAVTPAEEETRSYSNRFAGHVLRQHVFAALCRARGWTYRLQGDFDSANTPTLRLSRLGLSVELWLADSDQQAETSHAGISLYVVTDQVRFVREGLPVPLAEIPPIAFSEAMRDVDLFVGVCSIGNDPAWRDRGERPAWDPYWQRVAFGELSALARTRHDVLADLVPRLAIAERLTLEERFLAVRGQRASYRIHLGSGNVQIEPGSRYLCIVQDRSSRVERVALPFEGDAMLSLIVSKAFLLANDRKITDETILRQIR